MYRKIVVLLICIPTLSFATYCAFCDPAVITAQEFYEDDFVAALYTHRPIFPGHCLVIPKRHVERFEELSDAEILQIGCVIKKVNIAVQKVFATQDYLLLQKNGYSVGQTVPHVHFHYIPRKEEENSSLVFLFRMYLVNVLPPLSSSQMAPIVESLHQEMLEQEEIPECSHRNW